jgi:hypothetical protein
VGECIQAKGQRLVRRTILFLGTMLAALVVAGSVAFSAPAECDAYGNCDCQAGVTCEGTSEGEYLNGTNSSDKILGYAGDDGLYGYRGSDNLNGGPDNDYLEGDGAYGRGNDILVGGDGDDLIYGGPGYDRCDGGNGTASGASPVRRWRSRREYRPSPFAAYRPG